MNDDMEGKFFGGGSVEHLVSDGRIYLSASDLVGLFTQSGIELAEFGLEDEDPAVCEQGQTMMILAYKLNELTSELLMREIMKSL